MIMMIMTSRSYFLRERQKRKQILLQMIEKNSEMSLQRLKSVFSLQTGLAFKTINEYLDELIGTGLIEIDYEVDTVKSLMKVKES